MSPEDAIKTVQGKLYGEKKENFIVMYLNARNKVIETTTEGGIDKVVIYIREVVRKALNNGATALILAHNHPSGETSPSAYDISITTDLTNASKLFDIRVLDRIIVSDKSNYFSFAQENMI